MTEATEEPTDAVEPDWEPTPPGFLDRSDVKAAIEAHLERVREGRTGGPGFPVEDVIKLADERRRRRRAFGD